MTPVEQHTQTMDEQLAERQAETGERMLRWFQSGHLTNPDLRGVSQFFAALAIHIVGNLPASPERTVALRKLLESKDAAVRSALER